MDYLAIRLLASFLVGVLISQAGSLLQLATRNPLASTSTLGFDGLAVLWVLVFHSLALTFNLEISVLIGVPIFILVGLAFTKLLKGSHKLERLIMLGLSFNLFVGAIFALWQFLFLAFNLPFPVELWFGHFRFADQQSLIWLVLLEASLLFGLFLRFRDLQLFSYGHSISKNFNLNETRLFKFILVSVALATFVIVSQFGAFTFLSLIFPILARKIWFKKHDLEGEFLFGSFTNGIILMILDAVCYFFPVYGAEVPTGLIVTSVGALSLILILWTSQKDSESLANPKK
jgi:ferric hydroxamate transport system permease protein